MNNEQLEIIKKELKIDLSKQVKEKFDSFEQLFKIYNSHTNLVSKNDEKNLFEKHIFDSLCLNLFFEQYPQKADAKLLDIGTGGGFPSIPLALVFDDLQIYPIDSIAKKIGFIELVQKELRMNNIFPICKRVEELEPTQKESFDITVSRAVAPLNMLLEYAIPYLKVGGYFVAYKSKTTNDEIEQAQNALKTLNAKVIQKIDYKLPHEDNFDRKLIVIKKEKQTPQQYPRKSGQAKKNPL